MHSKLMAALVLGLLILSFIAVDVAGAAVSSSSSSTTKTTTTTIDTCGPQLCQTNVPQNKTFNPATIPNYLGSDIGSFQVQTAPNGFQWSTAPQDSLTMGIPTVGSPLLNSFVYYNSTHTAYKLAGPFGTLNVFFKQTQYQVKISMHANLNSAQSICLPFNSPNPIEQQSFTNQTSKAVTLLPSIRTGNEFFDWSDISNLLNPTWSNTSNTLCVSLAAGITNIDPLALDGSGISTTSGGCNNDTINKRCQVTLTTTLSPDVIMLEITWFEVSCTDTHTITSVTDTSSLSWIARTSEVHSCFGGSGAASKEYYAIANAALTGDIITAHLSTGTNYYTSMVAYGISGANTQVPFDPNVLIPKTNTGSSTTESATISTTNPNDMLVVMVGDRGAPTYTVGSGFTLIQKGVPVEAIGTEYQIVSSTQSSVSIGFTSNVAYSWALIIDAIQLSPVLLQEKTCTYTAQSSPTCQFTSTVTSGNIVYVIPSDSVAADTVSSITDSGSNTYYFITRQNSLSTVGNVEGWYSITTTGGTLTVTVNLGISLSGAIIINEIGGARNDGPLSSIGTGTGTATSVTSYSPDTNSLVIGGLNSGCLTLCTVTAGTSYTLDDNAAVSTLFQASSEHITNTGTAETTPFALSASSGWNEISVAFAPPSSPVAETATLSQTVSVTPALSRVFAGVRSLNPTVALSAVVNVICPQLDCIQRSISGNGSIMPWVAAIIVLLFISASLGVLAVKRGTDK